LLRHGDLDHARLTEIMAEVLLDVELSAVL
jgi:hypothetical protein